MNARATAGRTLALTFTAAAALVLALLLVWPDPRSRAALHTRRGPHASTSRSDASGAFGLVATHRSSRPFGAAEARQRPLAATTSTPPTGAGSANAAPAPALTGATTSGRDARALGLGSLSDQRVAGPMRLTIPRMARVHDVVVADAPGRDTAALDHATAIHLDGTGYPWQKGSNVYISGHRIGYPATPSFRAFYDLDELRKGDEVILTDPAGGNYVYRVYRKMVVAPSNVSVTLPVSHKNIVTLQSCTLPNFDKRLIVRAERADP